MERIDLEFWRAEKARKAKKAEEVEQARLKKAKGRPPSTGGLPIEVIKKSNVANFFFGIKQIGSTFLLIGIPGDTPGALHRRQSIQARIARFTSKRPGSVKMRQRLARAKREVQLSNSYLLSIFERGSPLRHQPPRPVFKTILIDQPSVKRMISDGVSRAAKAQAEGDESEVKAILRKTGAFAVAEIKSFFKGNNVWPRNSPSMISKKGFDKPGVFTSSMMNSFQYVLRDSRAKLGTTGRMERIT